MTPLYVVVNGGYRTGSTVAYNIVRQILREHGVDHSHGLHSHPAETDTELCWYRRKPFWAVAKTHVWRPLMTEAIDGLRVIYTYRAPADVAASLNRHRDTWGEVICEVQRQAYLWAHYNLPDVQRIHSPLLIGYEHYYGEPEARVRAIARHLGVPLTDGQVASVIDATSIERTRAVQDRLEPGMQDAESLIQAGHVGAGQGVPGLARSVLGPDRVTAVHAAVAGLGLST